MHFRPISAGFSFGCCCCSFDGQVFFASTFGSEPSLGVLLGLHLFLGAVGCSFTWHTFLSHFPVEAAQLGFGSGFGAPHLFVAS